MGKPLFQVIGLRLLLMVVAIVASGVLAYVYSEVALPLNIKAIVVVLFLVLVSAWPCLLVSALGRTLQYWQQWR
jgi:hypothetical protein